MKPELPIQVILSTPVLFKIVDGEGVLLDLKRGLYYGLNQLGARIWQLLSKHKELNAVQERLLAEYEVNEEELSQDLSEFINFLKIAHLVSVE